MKKAVLVIAVVALLGVLGEYILTRDEGGEPTTKAQTSLNDGSFTGADAETPYGNVKISIEVSDGKITDVNYLKMPNGDDRSRQITKDSSPELEANAIAAQSADFDFVSGATSTSYGFQQSLQEALNQANG